LTAGTCHTSAIGYKNIFAMMHLVMFI